MAEDVTRLFGSAVAQYTRYRTGYPPAEVARLAGLVGLDRSASVLDIGCGSGQLAIPLAAHAGRVIAIDPVPGMLAAGRARSPADNVTWVLGDSDTLEQVAPPGAQLATFAASFHWTDRPQVLRVLDRLLAPSGRVVVIDDVRRPDEDPDWAAAVNAVRAGYLGADHLERTDRYRRPPVGHRQVLAASPFADVQRLTWEWQRDLTVDEAVGLQFTYSFSTPEVFGTRAAAFAADARATILALHPSGIVTEPFRAEVLAARRR